MLFLPLRTLHSAFCNSSAGILPAVASRGPRQARFWLAAVGAGVPGKPGFGLLGWERVPRSQAGSRARRPPGRRRYKL